MDDKELEHKFGNIEKFVTLALDTYKEAAGKKFASLYDKIDKLENTIAELQNNMKNHDARMDFMKDTVKDLASEGISAYVTKLKLKENDIVMFNVPDGLNYDPDFFEQILPIFQEKNASVIVLHQGITVQIARKDENGNGDS